MTVEHHSKQSVRLPQFEMLRVLCMLGIVINHFFTYGLDIYGLRGEAFRLPIITMPDTINWGVLEATKLISLVSVNCFVLISGYFLSSNIHFRLTGIRRVWFQTVFYGVGIFLLLVAIGMVPFSSTQLFKYFLPVCTNQYWFVTTYLALMCVAPFLARLISILDRRSYSILLLVGFCLCLQYPLGHMFVDDQQLVLFVYLFMVGGYIRRFGAERTLLTSRCLEIALLCFGAMFALTLGKNLLRPHAEGFCIYAMAYHSLVLPFSVALFTAFTRLQLPILFVRIIPCVAPYLFSVYLIHSHPVLQDILWDYIGRDCMARPQWLLVFYCIASSLVIFIVCILVDHIRTFLWSACAYVYKAMRKIN